MCLVLLVACSPAYDWREVTDQGAGYTATFPDKPVKATRSMVIAGETVELTLHSARVDDGFFAVGTIPLKDEQLAKVPEIMVALQAAMQNNIGVTGQTPKIVSAQNVSWQEIVAEGTINNGKPAVLQARFVQKGKQIVEVIAMGESARLPADVRDQWFSGFRWMNP